ncbi:hypothetical protein ACI2L1_33105 [Streptomyces sp. NPDC019531]|uniref:hypothetical protein n=1 Tax=Streptomyces sp. NPDC019531 TaxID=3365062 RepID=UPI00384B1CB8
MVKAAALRRRREVLARIAAEPIDVPSLAPDRLTALAIEYRDRQSGSPGSAGSQGSSLDHWKVDYLRHRLARYDDILDKLSGHTGRVAAEQLLRRRIYTAIAQAYPGLSQECERRSREPGNSGAVQPPTPDDRKVLRRSPQEPT